MVKPTKHGCRRLYERCRHFRLSGLSVSKYLKLVKTQGSYQYNDNKTDVIFYGQCKFIVTKDLNRLITVLNK